MYTEKEIMDDLRKFVYSKQGQKYLSEKGVKVGGYTQKEMYDAAAQLKSMIIEEYYNVIAEIRAKACHSIEEFVISTPVKRVDGTWHIYLSISESHLFRPSMHNESGDYTGSGVKDIIALITNGYKTDRVIFGYWVDWEYERAFERKPGVRNVHKGMDVGEKSVLIPIKRHRDPNPFVQRVIEKFNNVYPSVLVKFPTEWGGGE